jgi:lipopolysaccharide/colanic/teichoic acid biosynthesis glycosyltransferase
VKMLYGGDYVAFKRFWETALLLMLSPIWITLCIFVAVLVFFSSPGSVLFIQERVGIRGTVFKMLKFRSMYTDLGNSSLKYALKNDIRVTPVGKWIRKYRLDELPQIIHVFTGEMSLIGVRPEPKEFANQYAALNPFYSSRHTFRPGLTGWAQVEYGYAASDHDTMEKLEYDLFYVNNISFFLDMKIFFKTIVVVLSGFGSR